MKLDLSIADMQAEVDKDDEALRKLSEGVRAKPSLAPEKNAEVPVLTDHQPVVRQRLVRDGYSMPETDHAIIDRTIDRLLANRLLSPRLAANKSLILRMALHALDATDDIMLKELVSQVPSLPAGRKSRV